MQFSCPRCQKLVTVDQPLPGQARVLDHGCGCRISYGTTLDGTFLVSRHVEPPPNPWYGKPPDLTGIFRVPADQEDTVDNREYILGKAPNDWGKIGEYDNSLLDKFWGSEIVKKSKIDRILFNASDENPRLGTSEKIDYLSVALAEYQQAEKYEECARLRDRIQELQSQIQ